MRRIRPPGLTRIHSLAHRSPSIWDRLPGAALAVMDRLIRDRATLTTANAGLAAERDDAREYVRRLEIVLALYPYVRRKPRPVIPQQRRPAEVRTR